VRSPRALSSQLAPSPPHRSPAIPTFEATLMGLSVNHGGLPAAVGSDRHAVMRDNEPKDDERGPAFTWCVTTASCPPTPRADPRSSPSRHIPTAALRPHPRRSCRCSVFPRAATRAVLSDPHRVSPGRGCSGTCSPQTFNIVPIVPALCAGSKSPPRPTPSPDSSNGTAMPTASSCPRRHAHHGHPRPSSCLSTSTRVHDARARDGSDSPGTT
jgi:hypothetical protein